jgi:hypothetical protein
MKQRAHAWVALRALKMIDDWGEADELTQMLSFYLYDVWDGAWLPDIRIVDMSYGHIYKMDSDPKVIYKKLPQEKWFVKSAEDLRKLLVGKRLCIDYSSDCEELGKPYRSHLREGGHLPNRVIAVSHMIGDMLKMSNFPLALYAKEEEKEFRDSSNIPVRIAEQEIRDLSKSPNFTAREIALTFFIISHYVCDAHMPLHCDLRDFSPTRKWYKWGRRLPKNLHPWIEEYWEESFPPKKSLILTAYTKDTLNKIVVDKMPENTLIRIDKDPKYELSEKVSKGLKGDEWNEMVYTTRVSYAVARKWISKDKDWDSLLPKTYGRFKRLVSNKQGFGDGAFVEDFEDVTNRIFHDAVESVARIWYKSWRRFVT